MFNQAMEIINSKPLVTQNGIWRPVADNTREQSSLDPNKAKYWFMEERIPNKIYSDYDNYERKNTPAWRPIFGFTFESCKIEDFENQLNNIYTDPKV